MMEIKYKDKEKSEKFRFETEINVGSKRKFTLMKEDYINLKFSVAEPAYFKLGDYVELPNDLTGIFELVDLQKPTYNNSTCGYDYDLKLDAYYWKWKNKTFMMVYEKSVNGRTEYIRKETSWGLTATLDTHLNVFLKNLVALGYRYNAEDFKFDVDGTVEKSSKQITYENMNLMDALTKMAETWACEWWVANSVIHFGRCEFSDPVNFEFGVNVEEMGRQDGQSVFATRIYAFGSTRNLPADYRSAEETVVVEGVVQRRLMLPADTPYIDAFEEMTAEEVVEDVVVFDDVYPHRIGTIGGVKMHSYTDKITEEGKDPVLKRWNAYRFKDAGRYDPETEETDAGGKLLFSEKYILPGQELRILFQSGTLNGMDFAVIFNPCDKEGGETPIPDLLPDGSCNPAAQVFEIKRNEDYGRELPGDALIPKDGDRYVLYGYDTKWVDMALIDDAEDELKKKALEYMGKTKQDPSVYTCKMDSGYIYSNGKEWKSFEVGARVNLIHPAYCEEGRVSRIIGFEYNLDIPYDSPVYMVGETSAYSRLGELEGKLDALTYKGQTYTGSGGGIYLITSNDKTQPGDRNAYSAKRALGEFLNKKKEDRAEGLITFAEGLTAEGFVEANNGLIVRSSSTASQQWDILQELTEEGDPDILSYRLIEESNSESLSVALLEETAADIPTGGTLGGLKNVGDEADDTSFTDDVLIRKAGASAWGVNTGLVADVASLMSKVFPFTFSFSGGGIFERGSKQVIKLAWSYDRDIESQKLDGKSMDVLIRGANMKNVISDSLYTLSVVCGGQVYTKSVSVLFQLKKYYGVSEKETLTNDEILALPSVWAEHSLNSTHFDCTGGRYPYYILPTAMVSGIQFLIGGLKNTDWDEEIRGITNDYGYTENYTIFRLNHIQTGVLHIEVK